MTSKEKDDNIDYFINLRKEESRNFSPLVKRERSVIELQNDLNLLDEKLSVTQKKLNQSV